MPQIDDLPLEERAIKAIEVARKVGYLEADDTHVGVLSASNYSGSGFFTGAYDLKKLEELKLL